MIVYGDVMKMLAEHGWSSYELRNRGLLGEAPMTSLRKGQPISIHTIDVVCRLCECQPGDFLRYEPDEESE